MKVALSWLADYVDIAPAPEELARILTFAGLEVEGMHYLGREIPTGKQRPEAKISGLAWSPEHLVVGDVLEVGPHPNADRLVLVQVDEGKGVQTAVTGAPDLFAYKGKGRLDPPLKVAYAREGARLYDGHKAGQHVTKLKRSKIHGVESSSMVCSEKELGISEEHDGIILFDADAPAAGTPLADYIGDVIFDIAITPNMARNACVLGVAREAAALLGTELRPPRDVVNMTGPPIAEAIRIEIQQPELNPRFTVSLLDGVTIGPSPYWLQLRLRLAGMRPINNIVDITNYVMLEHGQPLHAFDYDVLCQRAVASGAEVPTLITRLPEPGEGLATLDGVERTLNSFTVLVCDTAGVLSLGGIMGGAESEVSDDTTRVLLEAASWNLTNIRRTVQAQKLSTSEAGYRFSRGVHQAQSMRGNRRAIELMRQLAGGSISSGIFDHNPAPEEPVSIDLPVAEIERYLGVAIPEEEVLSILRALEFKVEPKGADTLQVTVPDHRVDIETGRVGIADLIEEIARIYGYERIPETQINDSTPAQRDNPSLEGENRLRDALVRLGLQELITYRVSTPEKEAKSRVPGSPADSHPWIELANPIAVDRTSMRHSLLASVLEIAERNSRVRDTLALFEIGKVFIGRGEGELPDEPTKLAIVLSGPRQSEGWSAYDASPMDFFDLKGLLNALAEDLHIPELSFVPVEHPSFHPGRSAEWKAGDLRLGTFGELHPEVRQAYDLGQRQVLAAELDVEALLMAEEARFTSVSVPRYPAVVEDLALVVDEAVTASTLEGLIRQSAGKRLADLRLFDLYRGEQLGKGKKSLAYRMAFQSSEGTLTDKDAAKLRGKILRRLETEVGAVLRG
jgi:phenylalanyl-tRNA synthetase beta chain